MKRNLLFPGIKAFLKISIVFLFLLSGFFTQVFGQTNTWDGSSNNNWNTAANWSLNLVPTNAHNVVININAAILVDASPTINSLTISNNTTVSFTSSGAGRTITIDNSGSSITAGSSLSLQGSTGSGTRSMTIAFSGTGQTMLIEGNLILTAVGEGSRYIATNSITTVTGTITKSSTGAATTGVVTSTAANLSFLSGGTYVHGVNGNTIPYATWDANSNCNITGITSTISTVATFNQSFGNFTWNCTGQTGTPDFNGNLRTIKGNFTVSSTNGRELRLSSGETQTLNVTGNFIMTDGILNFNSSSGTFTMNVAGNFTHSGGTITETNTGFGSIVFNGTYNGTTGMQTYTSGGTVSNTINFTVNSGAYLQMAAAGTTVTGGGTFTLANGGTLGITSAAGITSSGASGNIQVSGTRTFNTGADYIYNGTNDQNTGNGLPGTVRNLTFSGSGTKTATQGVAISQNLTIGANTTFAAGTFAHSLQGNWINNGSFTASTSTFTINGSGAQIIGGASSTTFNNLTINKGGSSSVTLENTTSATGALTMNNGFLDIVAYNLTVGSTSGGSAASYVKTSGTGRLTQQINPFSTKVFPVGKLAFNPISITTGGNTDVFNVRVSDDPITDSNDNSKTVNRRWYVSKNAAGTATITVALTYNPGEEAANFNPAVDPKVGYYSGSYWAYENVSVAGTTFTATGIAEEMAVSDGYLAIGSGNSFTATKLAVTNINPQNPTISTSSNLVTVQSQNSQGVPVRVSTATDFELTALNTTLASVPTGTIDVDTYEKIVDNVGFTETTFNGVTYDHDATLTATRTFGEDLAPGVSAPFDVLAGDFYEPTATGNWSTVTWRKSSDGGVNWTSPATLPAGNNFSATELIRVPEGITLTADVTASFYSLGILGTMEISSSGALTLNHAVDNNDYSLLVRGILINSGGTLTNSNESYPISILGGTYQHNMNGGSIPVATWTTYNSSVSTCIVNGITSTALTAGLNQTFQNFTWNNPSQVVTQNLIADMTVNGNLTLTSGKITTGSYRVTVGLNGTASNSGMGYIDGTLRRYVSSAVTTGDFPIGEGDKYAPFSISTTGTPSGNGFIEVSTSTAVPPVASGLNQGNYISRKWTVTNNGVGGVATYSPSFTYVDADKVGTVTGNLKLRKLTNNIWYTTNGAVTGNTMTANNLSTAGLIATSDFYIGEDDCSSTNFIWLGGISTDWNTAGNWCYNQVPTSATDVTIPGGIIRYPVIGSAGAICRNITILNGASLTVSDSYLLEVKGNWSDAGTFTAGTGTVSFTGTTTQTITGSTTFNNLTINNSTGVTGLSNFTVNGLLSLTSSNPNDTHGTLDMGSYTLSMLTAAASVAGPGDLTGTVRRSHTFTPNNLYHFGSQFTTITFVDAEIMPTWIDLRISIGAAPGWSSWSPPGKAKRYYNIAVSNNASTAKAVVNMRYLLSELDVTDNDESKLVFWHKYSDYSSGLPHEHGKSNQNFVDHYIGVTGIVFSGAATENLNDSEIALAYSLTTKNTWKGEVSGSETLWETDGNWTAGHVPLSTEDVLIPTGLAYYPSLTASSNAIAQSIEIESGASITANDYDITITGFQGAWINDGTFNPGTGTLFLTHGNINEIVTVSGSGTNQFHNIVIAANTFIKPGSGFYMMINGGVSAQLTSVVDLSEVGTTVEYNGDNQIIVNPSHLGYKGYYNLVISGTGIKTLFDGTLDIYGNFTNNGTLNLTGSTVSFIGTSAQTISGTNIFNNLTINNAGGVSSTSDLTVNGVLNLQSENPPSLDKGALAMATDKVLNMGSLSTTTGPGDVTGIIKRTHTFDDNVFYTLGTQYSGFTFSPVAGDVKPTSITFRVTIGTAPDWTGTDWDLYNGGNALADPIKRITEVSTEGVNSNTRTFFSIHYRDDEIPASLDEDQLTFWSRGYNAGTWYGMEEGESGHNTTENYITIQDIDCSRLPFTLGDFQSTIAPSSFPGKTWKGLFSTDWNTSSNWLPVGVPTSADDVIIPSAGVTPFSPTLPATATCKTLLIQNGGILNAAASGGTLTITGTNEAWYMSTGGTFNANTSTVIFNGTLGTVTAVGETNFHNFTVSTGALLQPSTNSRTGISGILTIDGTLDAVTNDNIFEFNGTDQNIPNPNGTLNGYHDLVVSGSGIKIFPSILNISGDFTNNGNVDAVTNSSALFFDNTLHGHDQNIFGSNAVTLNNFTINNISGYKVFCHIPLTVNNTLEISATSVLDMHSHILSGAGILTSGTGLLQTQELSSAPIPVGRNWSFNVEYNAPDEQTLSGGNYSNLIINNIGGVVLSQNTSVSNTLSLTEGNLTLGTYNLTLATNNAIAGAPFSSSKMIVADNTGVVRKNFTATGSYLFPIGSVTNTLGYSPVTLNITAGSFASAYVDVNVTDATHPNKPDDINYTNRYWTITASGINSPVYNADFTYVDDDIQGDELTFQVAKYNGSLPWEYPANSSVNVGANTISYTNLTSFGAYMAAGILSVSASATPLTICAGTSATLTATASGGNAPYSYTWSPGGITGNPISVMPGSKTTYTVTVTDNYGKTATGNVTVTVTPTAPDFDATITNTTCPASTDGAIVINKVPTAVTFANSDFDYISSGSFLSNLSQFTLEGWIKVDKSTIGSRIGLFGQNDAIEFGFINNTTIHLWTPGTGGSLNVPLTAYPGDNAWHHIAAVGNGTNLIIYVDGVQVGIGGGATANYGASSENVRIGASVYDPITTTTGGFTGQMLKVGFWNTALNPAEINSLASGYTEYTGSESGLITGYNFYEGIGTSLSSLPAGNNGTFVNTPVWTDVFTYAWSKTADAGYSATTKNISALTTGEYNLTVSNGSCNRPKSFMVGSVSDKPIIEAISTPADLCDEESLNPATPTVTDNGSTVTAQGWQLETIVGSGTFANLTVPFTVTFADNGKKLRYYATNGCGATNSNEVTVTVNPLPATGEIIPD